MPGFRYNFEPEQISAIVQCIKTVPPQSAPATAQDTLRQNWSKYAAADKSECIGPGGATRPY
jgi:hypothetical protein